MYEGVFDHDMIEGNGIFYKRTGEIIIGFWIDNKLFLNQSYEHTNKWLLTTFLICCIFYIYLQAIVETKYV
jgi:hypothetical protein